MTRTALSFVRDHWSGIVALVCTLIIVAILITQLIAVPSFAALAAAASPDARLIAHAIIIGACILGLVGERR